MVVGAGLAGLSAACHLAGSGYEVVVVERETIPGGRAGRIVRDGFTFDTGPTVMTMPGLLADVVGAAGSRLEDLLPMVRLDPAYRAAFADGSEIQVRAGHEAMHDEIRATCGPADAAAFDDFVDWLRDLYELEMPHFIDRNFDSPLDLVASPGVAARLLRMGGFRRLGPVVAERFQDERLRRLFSFQAMYAGLPPSRALAIYAVITYMDSVAGVYFPEGGMGHPGGDGPRRRDRLASSSVGAQRSRRSSGVRTVGWRRSTSAVASGSGPTPSCARWTRRWPTSGYCRACAGRGPSGPAGTRRPRWCGTSEWRGSSGRGGPPQHPLRARVGLGVRRADRRAAAHAGPVAAGDRSVADRPVAGRPGLARRSTSWSRCRTWAVPSTGTGSVARCGSG